MLFIRTRRKEAAWEVVDSESVDPVPMYYDDEGETKHKLCQSFTYVLANIDLDIRRVGDVDACATYIFELRQLPKRDHMRNAVLFAREQLMQSAMLERYNVLLLER